MGKDKKKSKKHKEKKSKHKQKKYESSSNSSTSEDEWVEKNDKTEKTLQEEKHKRKEDESYRKGTDEHIQSTSQSTERDEWMNLTSLVGLFSNKDKRKENDEMKRKEKEASKYNPKTNVRELNPYWKDGGDGLPTVSKTLKFIKPSDDDQNFSKYGSKTSRSSNWRKKSPEWRNDRQNKWKPRVNDYERSRDMECGDREDRRRHEKNWRSDVEDRTSERNRNNEQDRSWKNDNKSNRDSNRSWREDNRSQRDDNRSQRDENRSQRDYNQRQIEDDRNWKEDNRSRIEDDRSYRSNRNWLDDNRGHENKKNREDDHKSYEDNYSSRKSNYRDQNYGRSNDDESRNRKDDYKNDKTESKTLTVNSSSEDDDSPTITVKNKFKTSEIIYESKGVFRASDKIDNPKNNEPGSSEMLTDKEMNDIAAKILKAEILGNSERVEELKLKLERAQELRKDNPKKQEDDEVLLTRTDSKGFSKPVNAPNYDQYDNKRKKKVVNTHDSGKRLKYYPDDDKHSLHNMFENEKFGSADKQDEEFVKAISKVSKSDDLDDMFMDSIRKKDSDAKSIQKDRDRAIREHQRISQSLDNCKNCIQSSEMLKHLMVSLGETVYLSLPPYEPITNGHCLLIPIRHVPCSTQLDENEWTEILDFRKSLTNMFKSENKTVVFYETAVNINQYPHMFIHCVPLPEEQGDLAPIYFKKGIDECETEWSTNKKLINMTGKDVRRSVPKGLPYFWVSFGMKEGFAHVIEEQKYFPKFFAEEIIGGILDLHHSKWRKSFSQKFDEQKSRVLEFSKNWMKYDCTNKH